MLRNLFWKRSDGRAGEVNPSAFPVVEPLAVAGKTSPAVKQGGRISVILLTLSAAGFAAWQTHEGYTDNAVIPTKGDVPTIGHGSTRYEDGSRVRMGDRINRKRAEELARNLIREDEKRLAASMPGAKLTQNEWDAYVDFVGQYGMGNWSKSSMRREVLAGNYAAACKGLLRYRFAAGYDCSTLVNGQPNRRCWGVWLRQKKRYDLCVKP